jgi:pyridoxamine 5'-phosphate oxidase
VIDIYDGPAPADPWEILSDWLPDNLEPERPLMTLCSRDGDGVDGRTLVLTAFDRDGFYFHTDSRSRKVAQVDANEHAALVMFFGQWSRQITVQGVVEPVDESNLQWAYEHRREYLKELAWLNTPEFALKPLGERIAEWKELAEQRSGSWTPPDTWAGRRVRPTRLTFWAGRDDTCSRRTEYRLIDGQWKVSILAG